MKKATLTFLKLAVAAAIAVGASGGPASAQSLVKGTFTLPYEVRWGHAVLPAGHYSITIDEARRPALVKTLGGEGRAFVMAQAVGDAMKDQPSALIITNVENQRVVRTFNWREGNQSFVYQPLTKAERRELARTSAVETVPILMAQK